MTKNKNTQFAVVGLGRFGLSIVRTLSEYNVNILACDHDLARLHAAKDYATHWSRRTSRMRRRNKGWGSATSIWSPSPSARCSRHRSSPQCSQRRAARAIFWSKRGGCGKRKFSRASARIQVVLPKLEMGAKVARLLAAPGLLEILEESEYYTISEMHSREEWVGKTLPQADICRKNRLTVMGVRHQDRMMILVPFDRAMEKDDVLITLSERRPPQTGT